MTRRPRICLIAPGLLPVPATQGGAIETLMTSLIKENECHDQLDLTVVTTFDDQSRTLADGIRHTEFLWIPRSPLWRQAVFRLSRGIRRRVFRHDSQLPSIYYARALRALDGRDFDAVIIEGGPVNAPTAFISKFGNHLWYHLHFTPENDFTSRGYSTVLSVSDFASKAWVQHCSGSSPAVITVRNGIDTSKFAKTVSSEERDRIRQSLGFSPNDFVLMYCGRIIPVKGVLELLHAVEHIDDPHIKLLIIGSSNFGPSERTDYTDAVTAAISRLGSRVAATGFVPNDQVYRYSHIADVQVVPSLWEESAGLVGVEGMAAGLPLVVTRSGGIQEYVPDECSIAVDRGDGLPDALANAITSLCDDPDRRARMARAGEEHARLFDTAAMYDRFVQACKAGVREQD